MTLIKLAVLVTLLSLPHNAKANDNAQWAAVAGYIIGASLSGNPSGAYVTGGNRGYYDAPDPLHMNRPQYNYNGGVIPYSKGGSHNPYHTVIHTPDGLTQEIIEYIDWKGVHVIDAWEY